jgi:signal transduction histidine kinase
MKTTYIYQKITLTLLLLSIALIAIIIGLYIVKEKQQKIVIEESHKQLNNEANTILKLKTSNLKQIVYDYTFYDEFITAIYTNDTSWLENNITTVINSYHVDYVCAYDTNLNKIHEAASNIFSDKKFISQDLFTALKKRKFVNFFYYANNMVTEISAATIHPNNDPSHTLTNPRGFLFIAKVWTTDFTNELSELSSSKVSISSKTNNNTQVTANHIITVPHPLNDWNNNIVATVIFKKTSNTISLYHKISILLFATVCISVIIIWIALYFALRKWVNKPLKLITSILTTEDEALIADLQNNSGEYQQIGNLFERLIRQKKELKIAKAKAEESNQLKSAFLNNLSHEIRTPFNGILGFLALLKNDTVSNDERKEYTEIIDQSAERLMNTVNNIIYVSQIETGQTSIYNHNFNITNTLHTIGRKYKSKIINKGLQFKMSISGIDNDLVIYSDSFKLNIILEHLLDNALKFTHKGSITLSAELKTEHIVFTVNDTGIGISENKTDMIFNSFTQGDITNTRLYEGSGLGLTIVKAYIEILGGTIWVESNPNAGSAFYFTFPFKTIHPSEASLLI